MTLTYTAGTGTYNLTSSTYHNLVKKHWDTLLHQQVDNKSFWKDMVGKDKGGEGSIDDTVANFPIVEKTQLGKDAGDAITMGLVKALGTGDETTVAVMNYGKVARQQLVDNEDAMVFYYLKVSIGHWRTGVLIDGKLTEKRQPFNLQSEAQGLLSTRLAKYKDDGVINCFYMGYSPNVLRENGTTSVTHPNIIYGKDRSALTGVDATDVVDTALLENLGVACQVTNINPVMIEGKKTFGFLVHPYGMKTLRADSAWKDANIHALPRGESNPIFTRAEGQFGGIYVMEDNRISTAKIFGSVTVTTNSINNGTAFTAATMGDGITSTDVRMNILFGANAIARAETGGTYMARRKEDDYGNLAGFAGGMIYGDRRADWIDDAASGTTKNQSSVEVYTHSPNPNTNFSSIW